MNIVICELHSGLYGFPYDSMERILEAPVVTPLPFMPDYIDGLINVGGRVVHQIDLTKRLGYLHDDHENENHEKELMVVNGKAGEVALVVDRVVVMADIPLQDVRKTSAGQTAGPSADARSDELMIEGEFLYQSRTVLLLAVEQLLAEAEPEMTRHDDSSPVVGQLDSGKAEQQDATASQNYMVVGVSGELFALPLLEIDEVLDLTQAPTPVPGAPVEVAGIVTVRRKPVLSLDLSRMMTDRKSVASKKLVIVSVSGNRLGLRVDDIHGISKFSAEELHALQEADRDLHGYLQDDDGNMIGLLGTDLLFAAERMQRYRQLLVAQEINNEAHTMTEQTQYMKLLSFEIGAELCGIELDRVQRVESAASHTELSDLDKQKQVRGIDGVVQIHGIVMPVFDLRRRFGAALTKTQYTSHIVVTIDGQNWALVVDQLSRVLDIPQSDMNRLSAVNAEKDFISAIARVDGKLLSVLDLEQLLPSRLAAA